MAEPTVNVRRAIGGWIVTDRYGSEELCTDLARMLWLVALKAGADTIHTTITVTPKEAPPDA